MISKLFNIQAPYNAFNLLESATETASYVRQEANSSRVEDYLDTKARQDMRWHECDIPYYIFTGLFTKRHGFTSCTDFFLYIY